MENLKQEIYQHMNELRHYGVKGMKWGVVKEEKYTGGNTSRPFKKWGSSFWPNEPSKPSTPKPSTPKSSKPTTPKNPDPYSTGGYDGLNTTWGSPKPSTPSKPSTPKSSKPNTPKSEPQPKAKAKAKEPGFNITWDGDANYARDPDAPSTRFEGNMTDWGSQKPKGKRGRQPNTTYTLDGEGHAKPSTPKPEPQPKGKEPDNGPRPSYDGAFNTPFGDANPYTKGGYNGLPGKKHTYANSDPNKKNPVDKYKDKLSNDLKKKADEAKRKADEAKRKAEENRKKAEENRKKADEAKRKAEENRKKAEEEAKKKKAEADKRKAEEEAKKKKAEEDKRKAEEDKNKPNKDNPDKNTADKNKPNKDNPTKPNKRDDGPNNPPNNPPSPPNNPPKPKKDPITLEGAGRVAGASANLARNAQGLVNSIPAKKNRINVDNMTNADLQAKIKRMELENRYNDLYAQPSKAEKAKNVVSSILGIAGGVAATTLTAIQLAQAIKNIRKK